jgi:CubicO group peptidase (beta-lactamase class C family)
MIYRKISRIYQTYLRCLVHKILKIGYPSICFNYLATTFIQRLLLLGMILFAISCRALFYNVPDISDYKIFPYRTIAHAPDSVFYFTKSERINELCHNIYAHGSLFLPDVETLDDYIKKSKTAAFIIIRNDSILYEKYNKEYQENSIFNTFSVTKVFITTLIGIAIEERLIYSVDQAITDYLPEFLSMRGFNKITIRHLLLHTSGIKFSDSKFNPLSDNARYYYGRNLRKLIQKAELYESPGIETHYSSVNLQLLGLILERATKSTISSYMQEKIWKRIGMQYDATWNTDYNRKQPMEKSFACLNCTAIDLAKLGRLYLNRGIWNNQNILPQSFINDATRRDTTAGSFWYFQYNFRFGPKQYESYYARGLFGQLIYIYPRENIIIVRVGEADLRYNPQLLDHNIVQILDQLSLND